MVLTDLTRNVLICPDSVFGYTEIKTFGDAIAVQFCQYGGALIGLSFRLSAL